MRRTRLWTLPDTTALGFGPDVGQLTKGRADAVKVVKDYLPLVQHLKDYDSLDDHLVGYCPLGQGNVNVPAMLDLTNGRKIQAMIMVELDRNPKDLLQPCHSTLPNRVQLIRKRSG